MKLAAMVSTSLDSVIKKKRGEGKKGPAKKQQKPQKTQKSNKSKTITRNIQLTAAQLA